MLKTTLVIVLACCFLGCQSRPPKDAVVIDAHFPWTTCEDPVPVTSIKADQDNSKRLVIGLNLTPEHRKAMICRKTSGDWVVRIQQQKFLTI